MPEDQKINDLPQSTPAEIIVPGVEVVAEKPIEVATVPTVPAQTTPMAEANIQDSVIPVVEAPAVAASTTIENQTPAQAAPNLVNPIVQQAPVSGLSTPAVKKGIFKFITPLLALSVGAVIILGGASYSAYAWYQNPQKVVTDSLWSLITTKSGSVVGTLSLEVDGGSKISIDISAKKNSEANSGDYRIKFTNGEKSYAFSAGSIVKNSGDVYLKVADADSIVNELKSTLDLSDDSDLVVAIDKFVKKVDGTWIKITNSELKEYSDEVSKSQQCLTDAVKKYENDKTAISEIETLYSKNQFVVIDKELGQKDGNFGYSVKVDEKLVKSFAEGLQNTAIYKNLHECDDTYTIDPSEITDKMEVSDDSKTTGSLNLWINSWSHKIARIEAEAKSETSTIKSAFDIKYEETLIADPSSPMSIKELKTNIDDLMSAYQDFVYEYSYSDDSYDFDYEYNYDLEN